jgi:glycerol-3-phosphate cytidylyltransferase
MSAATERIVYTGGTFDLFHSGHVRLLRSCSRIADHVIVALNSDEFVERYKGSRPVCCYKDRLEVVRACEYVTKVVCNNEQDSRGLILANKANFVVIGSDWAKKDYYAQMGFTQAWLDEHKIQLIYVPYTEHISTTAIKNKLCT